MLPQSPTPPKRDIRDLCVTIYGDPKWGKSSLCANAEASLFIATEPGLNHLEVFQMAVQESQPCKFRGPEGEEPEERILDGWEYIQYIYRLLVHKEHEFKTVIFDTVDLAYDYCSTHVCKANGWQDPSRDNDGNPLGWGEGWRAVNREFEKTMRKFQHLKMGLFFVSHSKLIEAKIRTVENKAVPTLPSGARKIVLAMSDIVLYATNDQEGRVLYTKPHQTYEAGDRTECLPEAFRVPDSDKRLKATYEAFSNCIKGGGN
jgi:hypothetical protein